MNMISTLPMTTSPLPHKLEAKTENQKRLLESARALEAVFAKDLLSAMGDKLPGSPASSGGNIFADMFKDAIASELAKSESLGVSRQIYQETLKMAEKQELSDSLKRMIATKQI